MCTRTPSSTLHDESQDTIASPIQYNIIPKSAREMKTTQQL